MTRRLSSRRLGERGTRVQRPMSATRARVVVATLALSCAHQAPPPTNPFRNASSAEPAMAPQESLRRLRDCAVLVTSSPEPLDGPAVSRCFVELARLFESTNATGARELRETASRLEHAGSALSQPATLKQGLKVTRRILSEASTPTTLRSEYVESLRRLVEATSAIDDVLPLDQQRATTGRAFRAVVNSAFLLRTGTAPFDVSGEAPSLPTANAYGPALENAENAVLELARSRWSNGRGEAADALTAITDALIATAGESGNDEQLTNLRYQTKRLRETESSFGQTTWIKSALVSVLDVLERRYRQEAGANPSSIVAARRSVESIKEPSTLGLQRAMIQDALRATIAAMAAGRDEQPCTELSAGGR
jgi:hypothetical protein